MAESDWVIYDMTSKEEGPHFGPMTEEAKDEFMATMAKDPLRKESYWARQNGEST